MASVNIFPTIPPAVSTASDDETTMDTSQPLFGGYTRFEIELEFVQALGNPHYLGHLATLTAPSDTASATPSLPNSSSGVSSFAAATSEAAATAATSASTPLLQHTPFINYLRYLRYWTAPPYIKYLQYPGPTLKHLELLQEERFRRDIMDPGIVAALVTEGLRSSEAWAAGKEGKK